MANSSYDINVVGHCLMLSDIQREELMKEKVASQKASLSIKVLKLFLKFYWVPNVSHMTFGYIVRIKKQCSCCTFCFVVVL